MENRHIFSKKEVEVLLKNCENSTLGQIDNKHIFENYEDTKLQKGIAGTVIEQCVFGYPPDNKQEADLVIDNKPTELKTTGIIKDRDGNYKAKEPVSITAVSVYNISNEFFEESHFWKKLENLLFVYYEYVKIAGRKMTPYDYKDFPYKGYYFNTISTEDKELFKADWENVHSLVFDITSKYNQINDEKKWKELVKEEYINRRKEIRKRGLNFIDLAPKFPPRFRLKPSYASFIISKWLDKKFDEANVKLPDELDIRCREIENDFSGKTLLEISKKLGLVIDDNNAKSIAEIVITTLFTGKSCKLNNIDLFVKFGIIAKTCAYTSTGSLAEDTKLFQVDFEDYTKEKIIYYNDEDELCEKEYEFEDSDLYNYFSNNQFLAIIFEEPEPKYVKVNGVRKKVNHPLMLNKFIRFKRFSFSDDFINTVVKKLWDDTRDKILNNKLKDIITIKKGKPLILKNGEISSSPNFYRSSDNPVFIKGGATDSTSKYKIEEVNGIKMIKQHVWIHKKAFKKILEEE